jgi:hypothetical protein
MIDREMRELGNNEQATSGMSEELVGMLPRRRPCCGITRL